MTPLQLAMVAGEMAPHRWQRDLVQIRCDLDEGIDADLLRVCLAQLVERHESLRAALVWDGPGSTGRQTAVDNAAIPLEVVDLRGLSNDARRESFHTAIAASWRRELDVTQPPRIWAHLFRLDDQVHRFVVTYQETVLDEESGKILIRELFELYDAERQGIVCRLPPATPFHDYLAWSAARDNSENCHFWSQLLADAPAPSAPPLIGAGVCDHALDACCGDLRRTLSRSGTERLERWVRGRGATLNSALLAAWSVVVAHHAGEDDARFSAVFSERTPEYPNGDTAVAMCFSVLPFIVRDVRRLSSDGLLTLVRDHEAELRAHSVLPDGDTASRRQFGHPSTQSLVFFDEEGVDDYMRRRHPEWTQRRFEIYGRNPYAIAMRGFGGGRSGQLTIQAWYNPDSYGAQTVECLMDQLVDVLERLPTASDGPVAVNGLLPDRHRNLVEGWSSGPVGPSDERLIHQWFEEQAGRTPDAIAVIDDRSKMTFSELDTRANRLANVLCANGLEPHQRVGVVMGRSGETIVTVLAILKAGGVYIPIDASWPVARTVQAFHLVDARIIVTDACFAKVTADIVDRTGSIRSVIQMAGTLPRGDRVACWVGPDDVERASAEARPTPVGLDDPAYVIFTSGSTGTPKGVQVAHRPVSNLIDWAHQEYEFGADDRVLWVTSLGFDLSVFDIFGLLACGGSVRVADEAALQDPTRLIEILTSEPITFWDSAPQALGRLTPFLDRGSRSPDDARDRLRLVFLSGDWIPLDLPDAIRGHFPKAAVVALGGATEATVWSNHHPVESLQPGWRSVPYGRPIRNACYYILDDDRRLCGIGTPGELYIGGGVLADGYAGDPEQSQARFVPDQFDPAPSARMYRTGDLARWWPDGNMELLGRLDHQVKIRGYRIELGDIESTLCRCPAVRDAVAVTYANPQGGHSLAAYVVAADAGSVDYSDLRSFLVQHLPEYMIPATIVALDALPLTPNGKVDRQSLPKPERAVSLRQRPHVAPRTDVERRLAEIFGHVLQHDRIGIHDNFFEVGGDSLSALGVIFGAEQVGLGVSIDELRGSTLEQLARSAKRPLDAPTTVLPEPSGPAPLVPSQHWLLERGFQQPGAYAFTAWLTSREEVDLTALRRAWKSVVEGHEALRTRFEPTTTNGTLAPCVCPAAPHADIDVTNLWRRPHDPSLPGVYDAAAAIWRSVQLTDPSLPRLALVRRAEDRDLLFLFIPHMISDEYSARVLIADLHTAYIRAKTDEALPQPTPTAPFSGWSRHLATAATHPDLDREYEALCALPWDRVAALPRDRHAESNRYASARDLRTAIDEAHTRRLIEGARRHRLSVEAVLAAALARCLADWASTDVVTMDMTGNGRENLLGAPPVHRTIGYFSVIYPVLLDVGFKALDRRALRSVDEQLHAAPGRGVRFGMMRYLHPDCGRRDRLAALPRSEIKLNYHGLQPLCDTACAFQPADIPIPGMLQPEDERAYLLNVEATYDGARLRILWRYSEAVHHRSTIASLNERFQDGLRLCAGSLAEAEPLV